MVSDPSGTPWTIARQGPLFMGFSRQEYWSGLPFPSPEGLANPGIRPTSPALAGVFSTTEAPGKPTRWNCPQISIEYITIVLLYLIISPKQKSCVHAKSLQLCPTLCYNMDCSPPSSSVHGICQAILEWVAAPSPVHLPDPGRSHDFLNDVHTFYSVSRMENTNNKSIWACSPRIDLPVLGPVSYTQVLPHWPM